MLKLIKTLRYHPKFQMSYTWQMFDKVKQNMKHMLCTDGMFGPL